jgi:hypothetical protein
VNVVFSVAGLRAAALLTKHHGTGGLPFTVVEPTRLLLLVLMSISFLATWHLLYRR